MRALPRSKFLNACAMAAATILLALMPASTAFAASPEKVLYTFCQKTNCDDGAVPTAGLVMNQSGILFGTTQAGGKSKLYRNGGVVFRLDLNAHTYTVIHNFCAKANCADGEIPTSELIVDTDGNLYGTTSEGGNSDVGGCGVAYKLTHSDKGWTLSVMYTFHCGGLDGGRPYAGLSYKGQKAGAPWDKSSPLFGVTSTGGKYGKGTLFEIYSNFTGWSYKVLHHFKTSSPGINDNPLFVDSSGNLYGLTGGDTDAGTLYKAPVGDYQHVKILHAFCAKANCSDGAIGAGRPTMDAAGNIFGTTVLGGSGSGLVCSQTGFNFPGCGVAFEYSSTGTYSVIHSFCSKRNCADGLMPFGGLIVDASGTLYGSTNDEYYDFYLGHGEIFSLSYAQDTWSETVLYAFCGDGLCGDGEGPGGGLLMDGFGNLFGTTVSGGNTSGVAFEIVH